MLVVSGCENLLNTGAKAAFLTMVPSLGCTLESRGDLSKSPAARAASKPVTQNVWGGAWHLCVQVETLR